MKKTAMFIIISILFCFSFTLAVFAADSEEVLSREKDGLTASLELSSPDNLSTIGILLRLSNVNAANVSNIRVTPTASDGWVSSVEGDEDPPILAIGDSVELVYSLTNTLPDETGTDEDTPTADGGCASALLSVSAVTVIVVISAFCLLKFGKRCTAVLLIALLILPIFTIAVPVSAATTQRKIELVGNITVGEETVNAGVVITYDYDFSESEVNETSGMEKFEITYYYGPQGTDLCNEEYIKAIAECGFTSIPVEGYDPAINKTALGHMKKYGLTCSGLKDNRIINAISMAASGSTQAEIDAVVQAVVDDYMEFDNIDEWWIYDEPSKSAFAPIAMVVDALKRIDPEKGVMINLFPIYANTTQLGTATYVDYIDSFIDTVGPSYISYDHYHFRNSGNRKDFFENLEIVRNSAIESKLDPMLIILLTEHMGYQDLTKYQIEWEVNMCLTYGMRRISYFTFWLCQSLLAEGWSNACMDANGVKYQHYYDVQEINEWLLPLGEELFGKSSVAVFHVKSRGGQGLENGCEAYTSYGDLGEINAKGFVIGFFSDGSFMITNKAFADTESARNLFEFIDVTEDLEYFDASDSSWKDVESAGVVSRNENGNYQLSFEPGQGILFRVAE